MILILCQPRTGSSLVTKIFHDHGVWLGDFNQKPNGFGYIHFENEALRNCLKTINREYWQGKEKIFGDPITATKRHRLMVKGMVESINPKEPWAYKVSSDYYKLFLQFEPQIILVKRDEEQAILSACQKGGGRKKTEARKIYQKRMKTMKSVEREYGAKWVDTDELIAGNYMSVKEALEYCDLKYDEQLVDQCIDKKLWHKR